MDIIGYLLILLVPVFLLGRLAWTCLILIRTAEKKNTFRGEDRVLEGKEDGHL